MCGSVTGSLSRLRISRAGVGMRRPLLVRWRSPVSPSGFGVSTRLCAGSPGRGTAVNEQGTDQGWNVRLAGARARIAIRALRSNDLDVFAAAIITVIMEGAEARALFANAVARYAHEARAASGTVGWRTVDVDASDRTALRMVQSYACPAAWARCVDHMETDPRTPAYDVLPALVGIAVDAGAVQ